MKKILIIGFAMLFSFGIFAQSAEKNAKQEDKDAQDAFDYMDENGIEYEVDYKGAVKELPKDAKMLSVETVIQFLENVVVDVEMSIQFSENSFADPDDRSRMFASTIARSNTGTPGTRVGAPIQSIATACHAFDIRTVDVGGL